MKTQNNEKSGWQPCQTGAISKMVHECTDLKRRQVLRSVGTALGIIAVGGVGVGIVATQNSKPAPPTRLSCADVMGLLPQYSKNELEPEMMAKVATHINICKFCLRAYTREHQV